MIQLTVCLLELIFLEAKRELESLFWEIFGFGLRAESLGVELN